MTREGSNSNSCRPRVCRPESAWSFLLHREAWDGVWAGPVVLLGFGGTSLSPWEPSELSGSQLTGRDEVRDPLPSPNPGPPQILPSLLFADPHPQHTPLLLGGVRQEGEMGPQLLP